MFKESFDVIFSRDRAIVNILVKKGILTAEEVKEELERLLEETKKEKEE